MEMFKCFILLNTFTFPINQGTRCISGLPYHFSNDFVIERLTNPYCKFNDHYKMF